MAQPLGSAIFVAGVPPPRRTAFCASSRYLPPSIDPGMLFEFWPDQNAGTLRCAPDDTANGLSMTSGTSFRVPFPGVGRYNTARREYREGREDPPRRSTTRGLHCGPFEGHLAAPRVGVHGDGITGQDLAVEYFHGERILDQALDGALQGPCPKLRVVAFAEEQLARPVRQLDFDLPIGQQALEMSELQVDDLLDLFLAEPVEDHNFIDSVQKLGPEVLEQQVVNLALQTFRDRDRRIAA